MIKLEELVEKIEKEKYIWLGYYNDIAMHLYAIAGACFRAEAIFTEDETKVFSKEDILKAIDDTLASDLDDKACLDEIYSIIMNSYEPVREFVTTELSDTTEAEKKGIELAKMEVSDALEKIETELVARKNINTESLIRLQTLQWVMDIIQDDKKEA